MPPKRARQQSQEPEPSRAPKRNKAADDDGTTSQLPHTEDNEDKIEDDAKSNASGHSATSLLNRQNGVEITDVVTPVDSKVDEDKEPALPKGDPKKDKVKKEVEPIGKDWGYDAATNKRIDKIRDHSNIKTGAIAIGKATATMIWAKTENERENFYQLAQNGTRTPIKVWTVGNLVKSYFYDSNGEPPNSVSINVLPLDNRDKTVGNNILCKYSQPRNTDANTYPDIRCSKWTAVRRAGEERMIAEVFDEVYDARNGFILPREKMPRLAPKDLKKGDLVFVESTVARWHPRKEGKSKKAMYAEHNAYFCINFIALLDDGPAPQAVGGTFVPEEEDEVEF